MEKVLGCGELDYASEPICLQDFFNEASLQHHPFVNGQVTVKGKRKNHEHNVYREKMLDVMNSNLTDSEFDDLENICSSDNLRDTSTGLAKLSSNVLTASLFVRVDLPAKSDLETIKKAKTRSRLHERQLKYTGTLWLDKSQKSGMCKDDDLIPGSALVATVRIYAPFKHNIGRRNNKIATGGQEIAVLGSQTLADLRDKFPCASDQIICHDLSSNPFCKTSSMAKDKYKSGMIYIGDKFYDDTRHPSNIEYSETVLKWAKERHLNLGSKAKMEETKIIDLTVRLGYPYLYQHQGNCEHLFCFSDIRQDLVKWYLTISMSL
ncbi:snRNA-activating protein complex subunit 3 [Frankliniella fusca]|uniref:snRNA-activating protein complex subunit 3 n=1 Tax=Frankliniella fusca TaxID=407009 RepID=A0AAE1L9Z5_9NEOP|nr:snRNA-activating protein complex subunit 3 [Frankliniella fusca]